MSFLNYNVFKLQHLYYGREHVTKYLREELGDTDMMSPLHQRVWFTMPDGHVWIHKDTEVPKSLLFLFLSNA